jgi:hypothetical protein
MAPVRKSARARSLSENDVSSQSEVNNQVEPLESNALPTDCTFKIRTRRMSDRQQQQQQQAQQLTELVEQNENDRPMEENQNSDQKTIDKMDSVEAAQMDDHSKESAEIVDVEELDNEELNHEIADTFAPLANSEDEEQEIFIQKRARGRPRKSSVVEELVPTRKSSRQMLRNTRPATESEPRTRQRRDKSKHIDRYSPELIESKRSRRSNPIANSSEAVVELIHSDSDSENTVSLLPAMLHTKKMLLKRSVSEQLEAAADDSSQVYIVDVKKDSEEGKVLLTLTDGASYCIETKKSRKSYCDEDDESDLDVEDDDPNDKDYKVVPSLRRKSSKLSSGKQLPVQVAVVNSLRDIKAGTVQATGIKMPKMIRKANRQQQQMLNTQVLDETCTTKITTPGGHGKGTVTYITTPKSVSLTPASTYSRISSSKRTYNTTAKFLNEGPDLSECSSEDVNSQLELLPDRILLVSSDLPLEHSITPPSDSKPDRRFLFSQVISPMTNDLICLLCSAQVFREEGLLVDHYEHTHELKVDRKAAKFSEDIVFVCLPVNVIVQLRDPEQSTSVLLNASCQYCGDDVCLITLENMEKHYEQVHRKSIQLVEQEKILDMHRKLRCSVCGRENNDFNSHHRHLKEAHRMHTLVCRACPFTTGDAQRLSTHFRAKHLIGVRSQNMQCNFCNGICIGAERMNKHLISAHCVQTGPNEYSCTVCLQPHGSGEQLLQHSLTCPGKEARDETLGLDSHSSMFEVGCITKSAWFECFLCDRKFDTADKLDLHLHHVHARWGNRIVLNDTFLMVQHKDGKTDLMPSQEHSDTIALDCLPNNKQLEEVGAKTQFGYYCHKCECVIRIYQLFYLHMYNLHKQWKQFECRISTCKQVFYNATDFRKHVLDSRHPQYSVIERPLESIACHICDAYFLDEQQMEEHNLSDEHHSRLNKSIEKTTVKTTEARNFKCKTCHTWFGLMDSFVFHMENESHKHGCPHCGLHFALPSSRRTHIQSVHADRFVTYFDCISFSFYSQIIPSN